jgi:hypothetical protein
MNPYKTGKGPLLNQRAGANQKIPEKLENMISSVLKYIEATEREVQQEKRSSYEN